MHYKDLIQIMLFMILPIVVITILLGVYLVNALQKRQMIAFSGHYHKVQTIINRDTMPIVYWLYFVFYTLLFLSALACLFMWISITIRMLSE